MSEEINHSFGSLKQIDAGVLNVGYAEAGPAGGPAVILLHGWPYDFHSYVDVAPLLAEAGYRVIVPYLCAAMARHPFKRNLPQCPAVGDRCRHHIALMDALDIEKAILAGYDWVCRSRRRSRRLLIGVSLRVGRATSSRSASPP